MKNIFFFDAMLTPKIITVAYWLSLLGVVFFSFGFMMASNFLYGFLALVIGCVLVRVSFEMIMIAFKNNEYLRKIAEKP
ncbi:hypothetical protein C9426_30605 [Serratia sp. S1B]|nr:hypothetical protein C9426_30605 [Serratia sp. S1B]